MKLRNRSSVVCLFAEKILVFKAVDPVSKRTYWFLPGGEIEENESAWRCAERECLEETGYTIRALKESELVKDYDHEWNGKVHFCRTHFFRSELNESFREPVPVEDADYNQGARWLPLVEALEFFKYNEAIASAVNELVAFSK